MSEDLVNIMRREASRVASRKKVELDAQIDSFDPATHSAKVKLMPEGTITGWLPIRVQGAGSGASVTVGPSIGDACSISFKDGDMNTGEITGFQHNDVDRAPGVQSGEVRIKTVAGAEIYVNQSGNISITGHSTITTTVGGVTMTQSSAGIAIAGGTITHNGKDIGSDHTHTGVVPGGSLTGPPA